jgi:predicted DNA-binding transcriptional regulator YafY
MSKRGYFNRYLLIIKRLERYPYSTFEEIQKYMENKFDGLYDADDTLNIGFSKRTLQRDIREIKINFNIEIEYSKLHKGYFINKDFGENTNFSRMMESFDLFNTLNLAKGAEPFIHLEKRKPQGTEHLYGLIHAIKNKKNVLFSYHKYWENEFTPRKVSPIGLKEFRNRWYLLAYEADKQELKIFGLDRISNLEVTNESLKSINSNDIEEYFKHCFGISSPNGQLPQEILLSFDAQQGRYIKSMPLHESQIILDEKEDELQIKLKLVISFDFVMELLSYGSKVKVISPKNLKDQLLQTYQKAINQYK